jgi:hypothetical protein
MSQEKSMYMATIESAVIKRMDSRVSMKGGCRKSDDTNTKP